jgi:hypothetical protein
MVNTLYQGNYAKPKEAKSGTAFVTCRQSPVAYLIHSTFVPVAVCFRLHTHVRIHTYVFVSRLTSLESSIDYPLQCLHQFQLELDNVTQMRWPAFSIVPLQMLLLPRNGPTR